MNGRRLLRQAAVATTAIAAWLACVVIARAATYQVGPTRAYSAVGSLPSLSPGDIVEIDPATYNEVKRWTRPGTAAQPIIVRGVGAARPVFDATDQNVDGVLLHPRHRHRRDHPSEAVL